MIGRQRKNNSANKGIDDQKGISWKRLGWEGEVRVLACHRLNQPGFREVLVHLVWCASISLCAYMWLCVDVCVMGHQGMSLCLRSENRSVDNAPKARRGVYQQASRFNNISYSSCNRSIHPTVHTLKQDSTLYETVQRIGQNSSAGRAVK